MCLQGEHEERLQLGKETVKFVVTHLTLQLTIAELITCASDVMLLAIPSVTVQRNSLIHVLFQIRLAVRETESPALGEGECG